MGHLRDSGSGLGLLLAVMDKAVSRLVALLLLSLVALASFATEPASTPKIMPVSEVKAGMKGVAYTVFEGVKPEPMDVEVLGILKDANGPKGDIILVRLGGKKAEYTGVVAGMSGSPVYIDGKLVGAVAFRIGEFSKEPIAGVTPIEQMLEINALDKSQPTEANSTAPEAKSETTRTSGPGLAASAQFAEMLKPIETPLVFSGFTNDAIQRFAPQFASAGVIPVMGAGSV